MTTPTNFQPDIHATDWLAPYRVPPADAATRVDPGGRPVRSLDGDWHFAIDPYDTCLRARWHQERYADPDGRPLPIDFSFEEWPTTPVPGCWNTASDQWLWFEGSGVYFRTFADQGAGPGERVFLHFEGANYATYVFLNGEYLGRHQGGSTPFSFEVTGRLRDTNRLLVVVNNTRRPDQVPTDNTDWFNYGGLHRSVGLVTVPASFIRRAGVGLRPDGRFGTIDVEVEVAGDATGTAVLSIDGLGVRHEFEITGPLTRTSVAARPDLWAPGHPRLYDVAISLGDDTWSDALGFREIRVEGTDILLNGRPIFLKGVSQHEESVDAGRSLTDEHIRHNLAQARAMGCNFVRLAHYPHSARVARIADEVGVLLWEEVAVYWAIDFGNPATLADAANQLTELIQRDTNRASVVVWSVGNENPDTDDRLAFMAELAGLAKRLDPTRPVTAACLVDPSGPVIADRLAEHLDIIGLNEYYGWYEPDFAKLSALFENSRPAKPVIVSEFGADAVSGLRGAPDEMFTEDHQLWVYQQQIATLREIAYVKGLTPWILYDFRCPRRLHARQGYYNRKGLLDAGRTRPKLAYEAMRQFYSELPDA